METTTGATEAGAGLREVRLLIEQAIRRASVKAFADRFGDGLHGGKMLRARLILDVGAASGLAPAVIPRAAAAVELLHAASLLHDDVVDGGVERRGRPALWVSEGTKIAVLLGDLLMSHAVGYIQDALPHVMPVLVATLQEMCDAEVEQEFHLNEGSDAWARCVSIARRKTGSLFGFAAYCAGGNDLALSRALRVSGYALGTAYQLADDLLDTAPDAAAFGKTLGTDADTRKVTAASAGRAGGHDPLDHIGRLTRDSIQALGEWPTVQAAWSSYVGFAVAPVIATFTRHEVTS
jgi:geranylgeranyl pyrophosphate synthase